MDIDLDFDGCVGPGCAGPGPGEFVLLIGIFAVAAGFLALSALPYQALLALVCAAAATIAAQFMRKKARAGDGADHPQVQAALGAVFVLAMCGSVVFSVLSVIEFNAIHARNEEKRQAEERQKAEQAEREAEAARVAEEERRKRGAWGTFKVWAFGEERERDGESE